MVEDTQLINDKNRYFFHNESVGIVNTDIEMSANNVTRSPDPVYSTSPVRSRMESYKVNPMYHETSMGEQSSVGGKSSVSSAQEVSSNHSFQS